jgi:hypothetical protein
MASCQSEFDTLSAASEQARHNHKSGRAWSWDRGGYQNSSHALTSITWQIGQGRNDRRVVADPNRTQISNVRDRSLGSSDQETATDNTNMDHTDAVVDPRLKVEGEAGACRSDLCKKAPDSQ